MMRPGPLVVRLERIIERTYDLDTGIEDIAPFIIGDEGYARLYAGRPVAQRVGAATIQREAFSAFAARAHRKAGRSATARTLVREDERGLRVCLYYPDRLVENLERHDPTRGLDDGNVDDFATLVEELDHLLVIADRHRAGGEMSLLELELHGNVTKELTLQLFIARTRRALRLDAAGRAWIRHHLFEKSVHVEEDAEVRARYRDAALLAVKYLDFLHALPAPARPAELRRFHRRTHHEKIAQIGRL